jgi:membrane fusion protein (multidrug efflux system)
MNSNRTSVANADSNADPPIAGLLPESTDGNASAIAELRQEQQRLRERQDQIDRSLRDENDTGKGDGDHKGDAKKCEGDDDKEKNADAKKDDETPKKPLIQRVREQVKEHPVRSTAVMAGVVAAILGGVLFYMHTLTYEDTDDAEVDGNISALSPRVSGTIAGVYFEDNEEVKAGQLLADIDPSDLQAQLDQAHAQYTQTQAQLKADQPNVPITAVTNRTQIATSSEDVATAQAELAVAQRDAAQSVAQIAQADANNRYAQVEMGRMTRLAAMGAVTASQADQRTTSADATAATLEAQRQAARAAEKRVDEQRDKLASAIKRREEAQENAPRQLEARQATVALREAAVEGAHAQVEIAELNRSYAHIVAPVDGVVGSKALNIGDRVSPGQQIAAITQTKNLWITANFRETQLRKMHPGLRVKLHVDALDLDFNGHVGSMPGATGSRYSLLPPENATGNYVKVVQRMPVRIVIDKNQNGYDRLRPGMSVEPRVYFQ